MAVTDGNQFTPSSCAELSSASFEATAAALSFGANDVAERIIYEHFSLQNYAHLNSRLNFKRLGVGPNNGTAPNNAAAPTRRCCLRDSKLR